MITKKDIKTALDKYDSERSVWKVGMFSAAVDYVTTPFYYDLKKFYISTLSSYPENEELSPAHIKHMKMILKQNDVGPNSTNSAIVDLHESLHKLIDSNTQTSASL